jgi:hypothetical protein
MFLIKGAFVGKRNCDFTNKFEQLTCVCAEAGRTRNKNTKYLIKVVTSHISKSVTN